VKTKTVGKLVIVSMTVSNSEGERRDSTHHGGGESALPLLY